MSRLYVDILKHKDTDCTNNGLSSKHDEAILIWNENDDHIEKNMPYTPCIFVLKQGRGGRKYIAVPFKETGYPMFGGNFLYSSDSRFPSEQPIHIHDRIE